MVGELVRTSGPIGKRVRISFRRRRDDTTAAVNLSIPSALQGMPGIPPTDSTDAGRLRLASRSGLRFISHLAAPGGGGGRGGVRAAVVLLLFFLIFRVSCTSFVCALDISSPPPPRLSFFLGSFFLFLVVSPIQSRDPFARRSLAAASLHCASLSERRRMNGSPSPRSSRISQSTARDSLRF